MNFKKYNKIRKVLLAVLPGILVAALVFGANVYYDLDLGKVIIQEITKIIGMFETTATTTLATSGAYVGIGTSTLPAYTLDVSGALRLMPYSQPTGANGVVYYDSTANRFKCYQNGAWVNCVGEGGSVGGSGTQNYLAKWTATTTLGNSIVLDNGSLVSVLGQFTTQSTTTLATSTGYVGIGTATPSEKLTVYGNILGSGNILLQSGSYNLTLTPAALSSNKTITFPDLSGTVAVSSTAPITLSSTGVIGLTTPLAISYGGTATTSIGSAGSVVYSNGTTYAFTEVGTAGQPLLSGGTGAPTWGTLSTTYGGTGQNWSSVATGSLPYFSGYGTLGTLAIGSPGTILTASTSAPYWSSLSSLSIPTGTGAANYITKWTGTNTLSTSTITDDGSLVLVSNQFRTTATTTLATTAGFVGIATSTPYGTEKLTVYGNIWGSGNIILQKGSYNITLTPATLTASQTITFPNLSGTVAVSSTAPITLSSTGVIGLTTPLAISFGGTATSSIGSAGSVVYSNGTTYAFTSVGTAGQPLLSGGSGAPTWGTLSVSFGGTGLTSVASGALLYGSGGATLNTLAIGSAGYILASNGSAPYWSSLSSLSIATGTGAANYIAKWTGTNTLSTSTITDDGSLVLVSNQFRTTATTTLATTAGFVGIATSTPYGTEKLTVYGNIWGSGNIILQKGSYNITLTPATLTASQTITFPNLSGTVAVSSTAPITLSSTGVIGLTTPLAISFGGTATSSIGSAGSVVYSNGTTYAFTSVGTAGQPLLSGGSGAPTWGTLGTTYGGTGQNWSTVATGSLPYFSGYGTLGTLAIGSANTVLASNGSAPYWSSLSSLSIATGTGAANYIAKWTGTNTLSTSTITDDGSLVLVSNQFRTTATTTLATSGGYVGIGTSAPAYKLDVAGNIRAQTSLTAGINVESLTGNKTLTPGVDKMFQFLNPNGADRIVYLATTTANAGDKFIIKNNDSYTSSYFLQIQQGSTLLDYIYARAIREYIFDGTNWVSGDVGTGIYGSDYNVAIGYNAKGYDYGAAVGYVAYGYDYGAAVGYGAWGYSSGAAVGSYASGYYSGAAVGYEAYGYDYGAAVGYEAYGYDYGAAVGSYATGYGYGVALGYYAGYSQTSASTYNVLVGAFSGYRLTTGIGNIIIGYGAGYDATYSPTTGSYNILIGYNAWTPATTTSNFLNIGGLIFGTGLSTAANTISSGKVGIRTTNPLAQLDIQAPDATHGLYVNLATTSSSYYGLNVASLGNSILYVRADGKVGIGTTGPAAKLHILGTTEQLRLDYDTSNAVKFTVSSTNALTITPLVNNTSGFNFTNAAGTSILNIDTSNQRVGIGTTAPLYTLDVNGSLRLRPISAPTATSGVIYYDSSADKFKCYQQGGIANCISNGVATIIVAASDSQQKYKADYICSGSGDQTTINNAISALPSGGGIIYLLEGTYNVSSTITITKSNVAIIGSGKATVLKRMWNETTANNSGVITVGDGTNSYEGILISNLQIDGNKGTYTNTNNHAIFFKKYITKSKIKGNWIQNSAGYGIYFYATVSGESNSYNIIEGNDIRNNYSGIHLYSSSNNTISGNTAQGNGYHGIYLYFSSNNTISGNTAQGNSYGIYLYYSSNNNTISGNTVQGNSYGIYLYSSSNNTISGNTAQGNSWHGIYLYFSSNNTVSGNTVQGNSYYGIYLYSSSNNNTISGNTAQGNSYGIYLYYSSNNNTISGNTVQGNSSDGIYLYSSSYNTVSGNTVQGNSYYGIYLSSSSNNTISGNKIHDNGGSGAYDGIIIDSNSDANLISSNDITDTAGISYAINISSSDCDNNYLVGNRYSGTGASSINDSGTGTIYGSQLYGDSASANLILKPLGYVGIGTTTPVRTLDVNASVIKLGDNTAAPTRSYNGDFAIGSSGGTGKIWIRSQGTNYYFNSAGSGDVSEFFLRSEPDLEPGDVVSIDKEKEKSAKKSVSPYESTLLGVVSASGTRMDDPDGERIKDPNYVNVGLLGKLPVKVSLENGPIKIGDYLTSSNHPGVAMKATEPGKVIGIALESSEKCKDLAIEQCKIMVFVNPHWSIGSLAEDGNLTANNETTSNEQLGSEQSGNEQRTILDKFTLAIKNSLKKLGLFIENGIAQIKEIITEKLSAKVVVTNQLCLGQTCIDEEKLKELLERSGTMGATNNGTTNNEATSNGTTSNGTMNSEQSGNEQSNNEQSSNEQSGNLTETEPISNNSEPSTTTTQ